MGSLVRFLPLILVLTAIELVVKRYVAEVFTLNERLEILPVFSLVYVHNYGVSFSFLEGMSALFLIGMISAICLFVLWLFVQTPHSDWLARLGFALVLSGALGNLIDRIQFGYVIDYVLLHYGDWRFAIFNLADVFITIGALCIVGQELVNWQTRRRLQQQVEEEKSE